MTNLNEQMDEDAARIMNEGDEGDNSLYDQQGRDSQIKAVDAIFMALSAACSDQNTARNIASAIAFKLDPDNPKSQYTFKTNGIRPVANKLKNLQRSATMLENGSSGSALQMDRHELSEAMQETTATLERMLWELFEIETFYEAAVALNNRIANETGIGKDFTTIKEDVARSAAKREAEAAAAKAAQLALAAAQPPKEAPVDPVTGDLLARTLAMLNRKIA